MIDSLESTYDCSEASHDLPELLSQLDELNKLPSPSKAELEERNRVENQIRFIRNKCDIPKEG